VLTKQMLYHLSHTCGSFCSGYFGEGISQIFCLGWSIIMILLISVSHVAKIIGVSHWYPTEIGVSLKENTFMELYLGQERNYYNIV
jgi:hypothetical protein